MEYRQLGSSALKVSAIGLGSWLFGKQGWGAVDDNESIETIHLAIDNGINFIDTAPIYGLGHSETIIGKALKQKRDKVILASKCGLSNNYLHDLSAAAIQEELKASLQRLQTDYIDLYQPHWPDPNTSVEETIETLLSLKKKGLIREIGFCNHPVSDLKKVIKLKHITSTQNQYSMINQDIEKELIPFANTNNLGVIVYGALHGGLLSGKYTSAPNIPRKEAKSFFYNLNQEQQWNKAKPILQKLKETSKQSSRTIPSEVLTWTMSQKGITTVLIGARNRQQLEDSLEKLF